MMQGTEIYARIYAIKRSREAKREIDQIGKEARQQYDQWKEILSGTMGDKQLSIGLTLLFVFYIFYASFNSISGENKQDEDLTNCTCKETHRIYYQTLILSFSGLWVICFGFLTIRDLIQIKQRIKGFRRIDAGAWVRRAGKTPLDHRSVLEDPSPSEHTPLLDVSSSFKSPGQIQGTKPQASVASFQVSQSNDLKSVTLKRLDHYEKYLWLQFNQMYSVGAAQGKYEELTLPQIKHVVADEKRSMKNLSIQINGQLANDEEVDELFKHIDKEGCITRTADIACSSIAFFLYPFLLIVRFMAQVSLIPLLILQALDAYAWICVMKHFYCSNLRSEYQLGLDRTAISLGFYWSILVSILTSTMLRWFPYSKKAEISGAVTIA